MPLSFPYTRLLLAISFITLSQASFANEDFIHFSSLGPIDGLSQSDVNCLLQDEYGFMWIGTKDGLNRYDGKSFKIFQSFPAATSSSIESICKSHDQSFWLVVGKELWSFDPATWEAKPFHEDLGHVTQIYSTDKGNLWIGNKQGLMYLWNPKTKTLYQKTLRKDGGRLYAYSILGDQAGNIWVGSNFGLFQIKNGQLQDSIHGNSISRFFHQEDNKKTFSGTTPWKITVTQKDQLLVGVYDHGIEHFQADVGVSWRLGVEDGLPINKISSVFYDSQGNIWIGTLDSGLIRIDGKTQQRTHFQNKSGTPHYISGNMIMQIYEDRAGGIWVATLGGGINYYNPYKNKFKHYKQEENNSQSLSNNYVFGLEISYINDLKSLWVGTHYGGLDQIIFDETGTQQNFFHYGPDSGNPFALDTEIIIALQKDSKNELWIGSFNGLFSLSYDEQIKSLQSGKQPRFQEHDLGKRFKSLNIEDGFSVWCVLPGDEEDLWLGTSKGLIRYWPEMGKAEKLLERLTIRCIFKDDQNNIWLGANQGLYFLSASQTDLSSPQQISVRLPYEKSIDPGVLSIQQDKKGRIWVGTDGYGLLVKTSLQDTSWQQFLQNDGLPNNIIKGILFDSREIGWLSTYHGLSRFQPDSILLSTENTDRFFRNFTAQDGLYGNEFSEGAAYKDRDGLMYFGGNHGLNVFDPLRIAINPAPPRTMLTKLRILDKDINLKSLNHNQKPYLQEDITLTDRLKLSYKDYGFTLYFSALDFVLPEKNQFAYKLDGFDPDWNYVGTQAQATYTNLDGGTYTFYVRGTNNDQQWGPISTPLQIYVQPPPWKSWWAYALYFTVIAGSILAIFQAQIQKRERAFKQQMELETARQQAKEQVRKNTAADFHDELGNKMTKISLYVELARRSASAKEKLNEYLNLIENNSQYLSQGLRDFIWMLDPSKDSLFETMSRLQEFGDQLFAHTGINFHCKYPDETIREILLPHEVRKHILMITKEAMHNSLKYADCETVELQAEMIDEQFHLKITDNGKGFQEEAVKNGYGLENMRNRAKKIAGELSIESQKDTGTVILLQLPIPHMGD